VVAVEVLPAFGSGVELAERSTSTIFQCR